VNGRDPKGSGRPRPSSLYTGTTKDVTTDAASTSGTIRIAEALLVAVAAALFAGAGQATYVVWRVFVMHAFSSETRDVAWMAPLSFAGFILPATLLAAGLVRLWPRLVSWRVVIVIPTAMALFGILLFAVRAIHPLALLALSLGLAIRLAFLYAAHRRRAVTLTGYVAAALASLLFAASVAVRGLPLMAEARARGAAAPESADQPNVLLIILDTVRAADMGLFGYFRDNTPQLARFAEEGVRFTRAIAPASWTLPTHASLFTGIDTRAALVGWQRSLSDSVVTLAEVLGRHGYVSAGFTANTFYTTWETGLSQGFSRWDDHAVSVKEIVWTSSLAQIPVVSGFLRADDWPGRWRALKAFELKLDRHLIHDRRPAAEISDHFLRWQESIKGRRFFAFVNLFDAHNPYVEPPGWTPKYGTSGSDHDTYDSSIAYMDDQLGRLFDTLRQRRVLDRTIVIVVSDHGEQFGEHGLVNHGNSLYMNTIHVPFLLRAPGGVPAGLTVDAPVPLSAVPATVLDLLGLDPAELLGQSLRPSWEGSLGGDSAYAVSWIERHPQGRKGDPATDGPMTSIVNGQYHWIRHANGRNELYAYREDSLETVDWQADSSMADVVAAFLRRAGMQWQP